MSRLSLGYSMFSLCNNEVTEDALSELVIGMCMQDDIGNPEHYEEMLRCTVNALHAFRINAEVMKDEDWKEVEIVEKPDDIWIGMYKKLCEKANIAVCEGDAWWEDHWPKNARWNSKELWRLAKLQIGKAEADRRAICKMMKQHKETETEIEVQ